MKALQIFAGPAAAHRLRERGLQPEDVRVIPAAAGGPKGLVLLPLDRFLFGDWLPRSPHAVHLIGASIGAWRMATACLGSATAAFDQLAQDYIHQDYPHAPGKKPTSRQVSQIFGAKLQERFGGQEAQLLAHPQYRLHVLASRGRHLLGRQGRLRTPLGYLGAIATNAVSRRALGGWLERVVFSDPREALPLPLHDYRTQQVPLAAHNLQPSLLASCSIPFWLDAVHDIPGAPIGAYWDGGITDYHLHLDYAAMYGAGTLALYPHFQRSVVPGWLDKPFKHRHRSTARLSNVVVLAPHPEWVARLPGGKLPDRSDFVRYGDDRASRVRAWTQAWREADRLADELAEALRKDHLEPLPLYFNEGRVSTRPWEFATSHTRSRRHVDSTRCTSKCGAHQPPRCHPMAAAAVSAATESSPVDSNTFTQWTDRPHCRATLTHAALALGLPDAQARAFAHTGQIQLGELQLMLLPLDPHPQGPWVAIVQQPRPCNVDESTWLDTLLWANAHALLSGDTSFALADNGDTLLLQRLPTMSDAEQLSTELFGALLLSQSVWPEAAPAPKGSAC